MALLSGSYDGSKHKKTHQLKRLQLSEVTRTSNEELGRGSYAVVFEVMVQGTPCAAKEVHPILMSAQSKENFYAECVRSSQLLHPNIVQFIGIYYPNPNAELPWLVMELMYTNVTGLIEQQEKEKKDIPLHFKMSILVDACQGLQFLHSKNIAHRDLSSNNILLTKHFVAKIGDLGMAKVILGDDQRHTMAPGTQIFMPPEALAGNDTTYGVTIDVFSLGCVCLHVIGMQWPMPKAMKQLDSKAGKVLALTELQRREKYLGKFQQFPTLEALIAQCLDDFPGKRPAVAAVLECLRSVQRNLVSLENDDIIQLHDRIANYKRLLDLKDEELAEKNEKLEKQTELSRKIEQLESMQMKMIEKLQTQLKEAKEQLTLKDTQLVESQQQIDKLQSQLLVATKEMNSQKAEHKPFILRRIELSKVELRKAERPWVRFSEVKCDLSPTVKETQELFRKFLGILNKLTPQKFETLAEQALQMPIDSEDRRKGCIDRIFIKALKEPNFSVAYAQLCRVLSKVSVEVGTGPDVKKKTFRSLLLTKCQQEFEKDKESDKVIAELKKKVEEAAPDSEEKKQLEELNEKEYRLRCNYFKFIGELFKIKMLSEGIMHECVRRLLQSTTDEEALECFAKLMFTIGKDLDHEKGQALIKQYMDRVELIINAGKISSRIKFLLQDVVELRNANWVPRRENNNPKKIDQIHREAKQEEAEKMRELAAKDGGRKIEDEWLDRLSGGGDKGKKLPSSLPKLNNAKFRNLGKQPGARLSLEPPKLSMRPGGGAAATVDKGSRQQSKSKPSQSSGSKRSDNRSGGMSASGSGAMIGSGQSRRSSFAPDKHRERQKALELVSNMSGISRSSGSSSSSKGAENKPVSVSKRPPPDVLSEEKVEKKSSSLIAEFCQNVDYEAAIEEVKDMKSPGKHHRVVYQIVNDVLEKPAVAKSNTGKLFHQLIRRNVISKEKFTEGFTKVLEIAEDVEIDVPRIWLYLAEVVVPVIEDGTVSLDILTKAPASIMESGKGAQLLAEVLKLSVKIMGSGKATVLWTNSTVSYSTFKILNVEEFKKRYGLQFLPSSIVAHGDVRRLMELLRSRDNTNTEIMNCIEREYPESRERSLIFIRDLGMALFKTVIDGSGSYNEELLESRITIMAKYIEPQNDSNYRQLEFLYALQMVLHELEQPAGVANAICRKLSETGVFEDAAFHLWKTTGSETVGHGTTMLALKDFYDWLESTPVESDYSQ